MVAYLHRVSGGGYELTLCAKPCSGADYQAGEKVPVAGKREARAICEERNATPWNF